MRPQRVSIGILVVALFVALSGPVLAGGWATVRLDAPPGDVIVDEVWRFGFMVLQHDVTPNSDVTPIVRALHKDTGLEITATGLQEGPEGHFVAEIVLPEPGEWKWAIAPEPYGETSFETLTVLAEPGTTTLPASILAGSCATPGAIAFPLTDAAFSSPNSIAVSASTIGAPLAKLLDGRHAVAIGTDDAGGTIACGEIAGQAGDASDELVLGLLDADSTRNLGVAVLRDEGERTAVTLYLVDWEMGGTARTETLGVAADAMTVDIADVSFAPFSLLAGVGETVTWVNRSAIAHTVTGDDLAFDNSGLIEPGSSFSTTIDAPGKYRYRCGPHPDLVGEIVVT